MTINLFNPGQGSVNPSLPSHTTELVESRAFREVSSLQTRLMMKGVWIPFAARSISFCAAGAEGHFLRMGIQFGPSIEFNISWSEWRVQGTDWGDNLSTWRRKELSPSFISRKQAAAHHSWEFQVWRCVPGRTVIEVGRKNSYSTHLHKSHQATSPIAVQRVT